MFVLEYNVLSAKGLNRLCIQAKFGSRRPPTEYVSCGGLWGWITGADYGGDLPSACQECCFIIMTCFDSLASGILGTYDLFYTF